MGKGILGETDCFDRTFEGSNLRRGNKLQTVTYGEKAQDDLMEAPR